MRFILDGAHNPAAMRSLLGFVRDLNLTGRTAAILGFPGKKAWLEMLTEI
jgi:folylpolyglutamate synthase/dihydropteroate synthase